MYLRNLDGALLVDTVTTVQKFDGKYFLQI